MTTKRLYRIATASVAVVMVLGLTVGCTRSEPETFAIKFSHHQQVDSPQHKGALRFKELAQARAAEKGYKVDVQVFPAGQLGSLRDQVEQTQQGSIQMVQASVPFFGSWDSNLNIAGFPFLFPDKETAFKVLMGPAGRRMTARMEAEGFKPMSYWPLGSIWFTSSKPTATVADLRGQKIRIYPSPILAAQYEAWGATATPMDYAELYTALQQRVVDGQENPLQSINMLKTWEVQKYFVNTDHSFFFYLVAANLKWFNGLHPDLQEIVLAAEREAALYQKELLDTQEAAWYKTLVEQGATIVRLTDERRAEWRRASRPVWDKFIGTGRGQVHPEVFAAFEAELGRYW